jgi:hypothetical protein
MQHSGQTWTDGLPRLFARSASASRVWGSGLRVSVLGFGVEVSEFRRWAAVVLAGTLRSVPASLVWGSGFRVDVSGLRLWG